jgi:sigma-54 dependent transcriptional regulator, acetoin dehydrogenase operon transcriptional activator AcoR
VAAGSEPARGTRRGRSLLVAFPASEAFARPDDEREVLDARERLVQGSEPEPEPDHVRGVIAKSWLRCRDQQVDPELLRAPGTLDDGDLERHRDRHRTLLEASAPVMSAARDFLSDAGSILLLTDAHGIVIGVEGDADTRERATDIVLVPGATWDELVTGTNAIGTALAVGQAVQVHGAEHFCQGIQRWTCSASVVRDPVDASIVGAIDVSGTSHSYSRQSLAFVVSAAAQIEGRLKQLELSQRYRILESCMSLLSIAHAEGVILFDRRGFAIKANGQAAATLARYGQALAAGHPLRVQALNLEVPASGAQLPEWLPAARVEPVVDRGERIGTFVVLAPRGVAGAKPSRTARPAPVVGDPFDAVIGPSPALREAVARARMLAPARAPILLLGETGVGKELFARGLHAAGSEGQGAFVALNCAGLSRDLLASELFGYADGAFTGARRGGAAGKIEAAQGGTLFLDEIGEMPIDLQGHLLRALEQGEIYRVGESQPRKVQFRLISATNRELREEVAEGRFRMDLYYRVAVTSVRIPPLRDRPQDVEPLAEHYLRYFAEQRRAGPRDLSPEARAALRSYRWPGNVRELRNVIESVGLVTMEPVVTCADLPDELRAAVSSPPRASGEQPRTAGSAGDLRAAEAEAIRVAVRAEGGNLTGAARRLGIAKSTLYAKIRRLGLSDDVVSVRDRRGSSSDR